MLTSNESDKQRVYSSMSVQYTWMEGFNFYSWIGRSVVNKEIQLNTNTNTKDLMAKYVVLRIF